MQTLMYSAGIFDFLPRSKIFNCYYMVRIHAMRYLLNNCY